MTSVILRFLFSTIGQQKHGQQTLGNQNQRDAQGEFQMLRLMPDGVHAEKASHAAAQGGHQHQGGFPDAPAIFLRLPLVQEHKPEAKRID